LRDVGGPRSSVASLASVVADSRIVVLEGQGHVATVTAREILAAEVARFLA
jgi:hypothetical protein